MVAFACAVLWRRAQSSCRRRRGKISKRMWRAGARTGNALHLLEEFVHPHMKHVLQERLKEQTEQDEGVESDPTEHLLRQARRIQRGEAVETITVIWQRTDRGRS